MRLPPIFSNRSAVAQRLAKGFGANSLGKAWALLIQLISVPVLTHAWGLDGYGVWIMIATIPVYLGLSDLGLGTAAGVDMTAAMTRGDKPAALCAFQSVWLFMTTITVSIATVIIFGVLAWGIWADVHPNQAFAPLQIAGAIIFITLAALLVIQMSILKMIFQATHKYALAVLIFELALLAEGLAIIAIALLGGDILAAAAGMLCTRSVAAAICLLISLRLEPWCRPGWTKADRATLRRLMHPSLAALALTLANSLGLQAVVLAIGWSMGPAIAAIFSTTRMLTRIPLQFTALLSRASLPELTRAHVKGQHDLIKKLMQINIRLTIATIVPCIVFLAIWGPKLLSWLSHEKMTTTTLSFVLLGIAGALNALWTTLSIQLLATNRQETYAWKVLCLYAICAILPLVKFVNYQHLLVFFAFIEVVILLIILKQNRPGITL